MEHYAQQLAPRLAPGQVLWLEGPLGAGKTTLVRALVRALGGNPEQVSSPSYTLMHEYEADIPIIHVDAYRLSDAEELEAIGFFERSEGGIACVEWGSKVADLLRQLPYWYASLQHDERGGRLLTITPPPHT